MCGANCPHGGSCIVETEHTIHDTGYCTFTDNEALTNEDADALYLARYPQMAPMVSLQRAIEGMLRDEPSD